MIISLGKTKEFQGDPTTLPFHETHMRYYLKYQWGDNVLSGVGYHTPHGVLIDDYGVLHEWLVEGGTKNILSQCYINHHESHVKSPRSEIEAP